MARSPHAADAKSFLGRRFRFRRAVGSNLAIGVLLACEIGCNVLDLATSSVAFQNGLHEGNALALELATALGLSTLGALAVLKIAFASGAGLVALVGLRTKKPALKSLMAKSLMASAVLFLTLCLNNLYWILT